MAVSYLDPSGDGAQVAWTESPAGPAWSCLDDAVRDPGTPTVPGDYISVAATATYEDLTFPDTHTYVSGDTFTLHAYTAGATKRKVQAAYSLNDGSTWSGYSDVGAPGATGWYTLSIPVTSQAQLDGLRIRFQMVTTGGGSSGTVYVYECYVQHDNATTWYGAVVQAFSLSITTSGSRGVSGKITRAYSISYTTSAVRKTFAQIVSDFIVTYVTSGIAEAGGEEWFGACVISLSVGYVTAGVAYQALRPDADLAAGGWTTEPLWSKLDEAEGTVISATIV